MNNHEDTRPQIVPDSYTASSTNPTQSSLSNNSIAMNAHTPSIETHSATESHPTTRESIRRDADDTLRAIETATKALSPFVSTLAKVCQDLGGLKPHLMELSRALRRGADHITRFRDTQGAESEGEASREMATVVDSIQRLVGQVNDTATSTNLPTVDVTLDKISAMKESSRSRTQTARSNLDAEGSEGEGTSDSSVALMNKRRKINKPQASALGDFNTGQKKTSERSQPASNGGQPCPRNVDLDTSLVDPKQRPASSHTPHQASLATPFVQTIDPSTSHHRRKRASAMPIQTTTSNQEPQKMEPVPLSRHSTNMIGRHLVGLPDRPPASMPRLGVFQPRPCSVSRPFTQGHSTLSSIGSHSVSLAPSGTSEEYERRTRFVDKRKP